MLYTFNLPYSGKIIKTFRKWFSIMDANNILLHIPACSILFMFDPKSCQNRSFFKNGI